MAGRMRPWLVGLAGLALLGALGVGFFVDRKAREVASELVNPPFYHPKPLDRVATTYAELAAGSEGDPGGTWHTREVEGIQLWTLTRREPSRGHVLLLHGFGDDRWGTCPALRAFPDLDASIFTYRRRDDVLRAGGQIPITFGAREAEEVVRAVHALEGEGVPRKRIVLMGRSLGASIGLLALARLEAEGRGPLAGILWEGAPVSSADFGERVVRGPEDRFWHPFLAPLIGRWAGILAARKGGYRVAETEVQVALARVPRLETPSLAFIASQDRLAPAPFQRAFAARFRQSRVVETPTWHLNCSVVLGPRYTEALREAYTTWLPVSREP